MNGDAESNVGELVGEAAQIAAPFIKSQTANAAFHAAQALEPMAVHFGFALAHLFQGLFHHARQQPAPPPTPPPTVTPPPTGATT